MWLVDNFISVLVHITVYSICGGALLIFLGGVHWFVVFVKSLEPKVESNTGNDSEPDSDSETETIYTDFSQLSPFEQTVDSSIPVTTDNQYCNADSPVDKISPYEFGTIFIKTGARCIVFGFGCIGALQLISLVYERNTM